MLELINSLGCRGGAVYLPVANGVFVARGRTAATLTRGVSEAKIAAAGNGNKDCAGFSG
jgi:hypothetical protein